MRHNNTVVSEDYIRGSIPADIARIIMMLLGVFLAIKSEYYKLALLTFLITLYTIFYTIVINVNLLGFRKKIWFWYSIVVTDCVFFSIFNFLFGNINSITAVLIIFYTSVNALNIKLKKSKLIVLLSSVSYLLIGLFVYLNILPKVNILNAGSELSIQSLIIYSFLFIVSLMTVESTIRKIASKNDQLIIENKKQKEKLAQILINILPQKVIDELESKGSVDPIRKEAVSIIFTDMIGFTHSTQLMSPETLIYRLNEIFTQFDIIVKEQGVEKIKTIGDGYMCVAGLTTDESNCANKACSTSLLMLLAVKEINKKYSDPWGIRIGINTGSVIAGVLGHSKYNYDIWGDAVNIASRLESSCLPNSINISESTYEMVNLNYRLQKRGLIEIKGGRKIEMYELLGEK